MQWAVQRELNNKNQYVLFILLINASIIRLKKTRNNSLSLIFYFSLN